MKNAQATLHYWLVGLGGLVLALLVALGLQQHAQWMQVQGTLGEGRTSVEWDLFQFQMEHLKLAAKVNQTLLNHGRGDAMAQLALRYNLYLSRYDILRQGTSGSTLDRDPHNRAVLADIAGKVEKSSTYLADETRVPAYSEAALRQLQQDLEGSIEAVQDLVVAVKTLHIQDSTSAMQALRKQAVVAGATAVLLALVASAFGLVALRQSALSQQRNKKLEELHAQLERAVEDAEQANRAKGQFLATMSHEIRTPMNAILGMLSLTQSTELTPRQRDYASKTESAAQSLLGLLNDILDFSKIEAGKMQLEAAPLRLETLLRSLSVVLSANVGAKNIDVLFDVDPGLPAVLSGDPMRLQQILINLGGNAIKFTQHGHVRIALRQMAATALTVRIGFAVQDTGMGIAPEHQSHIFAGFSQAEASTTRRFGGTGLGLAICKRLIEQMGGTLQLHSVLGEGSSFSFALDFPVLHDSAAVQHAATLRSHTALVVDDNPVAGQLTQRMLQSLGWTAEWVGSGPQAVSLVYSRMQTASDAFPFSVVYADWQMPGMDGWETAWQMRHIAATSAGPQPVIVMLSIDGREQLAHRTEEEQRRINGFLVKPVTATMLREAAEENNGQNSGLRQSSAPRSKRHPLSGKRVLVVEDNPINQQVADELLSAEGARVSLATNGQLGVDAVRAAAPPFDVVLMDLQMPVMDGFGATRAIRQDLGLRDLPIVAMTANAMASDREACLLAGMNEHLSKPFEIAALVSLLLRVTGYSSPQSRSAPGNPAAALPPHGAPEIPGLDLEAALHRMAGRSSLYVRAASSFCTELQATPSALQDCLAKDDLQAAAIRLHTLKGVAGTLGASALAQQAAELERLCKQGLAPACAQALVALEDAIHRTIALLTRAMEALGTAEVPVADLSAPDQVPVRQALQTLHDLATAADLQALDYAETHRASLQGLSRAFTDALELALNELALERIAPLCSRMLAELAPEATQSV